MPDHITIPEQYASDHEREAYRLGVAAAESAATWAADGNTSDEHRRAVLAMLADGDPAAYDHLPAKPNLSGEWADAATPARLLEEVTDYETAWSAWDDPPNPEASRMLEEVCDAWEAGVADTFQDACERELWAPLADGSIEPE